MKKYEVKTRKANPRNPYETALIYELYRNGAKIYTEESNIRADRLNDLKRAYRRSLKWWLQEERVRLAVYDGLNYYFCYRCENIAKEYDLMKRLKKQLEQKNPYAVEMFDGKTKREYKREYKIVRVNA